MAIPLRIINNKKIALTQSEWDLYQSICKSYTTTKMNGTDLFRDLFEVNEDGIIIFLRPPKSNYTSFECYFFVVNVFLHQHLKAACEENYKVIDEAKQVITEVKALIADMKK
jgi:hypothetical protein